MRMLGGVPHGQHIVLGLVVGHDAACLQRGGRQARHAVALPDHVRGLRRLQVPPAVRRRKPMLVPSSGCCRGLRVRGVDDCGGGA